MLNKYLILVMCVFCACMTSKKRFNLEQFQEINDDISYIEPYLNDSLKFVLEEWSRDSLGILKLRNYAKGRFLIEELGLLNQKESTIEKYLGKPHWKVEYLSSSRWKYFFNTKYEKGVLADTFSHCFMSLIIQNGILRDYSNPCY